VVPFQTHVWQPQSFNPDTGLMYVGIRYATFGYVSEKGAKMGNQLLGINVAKRPQMAAPKLEGAGQWLAAWDPVQQKEVWRAKEGSAGSGTMTTAGNLVFAGTGQTKFTAFRADNGQQLWSVDAGSSVTAGAISYEMGGVQYIAVVAGGPRSAAGNRVLVYKLGGNLNLPPVPPPQPARVYAPENFGDEAMLTRGQDLYTQNCSSCHESGRGMGNFPDLRYSPMLSSDAAFKAVVIDGALTENGMLSFAKALTPQDAEAIRAHLTKLANVAKNSPPAPFGFPGGGPPPAAAPTTPAAPAAQSGLHQ
jgi:quinohemoprotein ethanol dehydrogenase